MVEITDEQRVVLLEEGAATILTCMLELINHGATHQEALIECTQMIMTKLEARETDE